MFTDLSEARNVLCKNEPKRNYKRGKELVGIDWSSLSSPSYTYTHCFSLNGAKI